MITLSAGLRAVSVTPDIHEMKCRMLESTPLFEDLPYAHLRMLADYMTTYKVDKDAVIFHEGEVGDFVCLVLDGRVSVFKEISESARKLITTIGPGKLVGEMAFIDHERRSATAVAASDGMLGVITRDVFTTLVVNKPALGVKVLFKLARLLSQRLRQTTSMLLQKEA